MREGSTCDTEGTEVGSSQLVSESSGNSTAGIGVVAAAFVAVLVFYFAFRRRRRSSHAASQLNAGAPVPSQVPDINKHSVDRNDVDSDSIKTFTTMNTSQDPSTNSLLTGSQEDTFFTWDSGGSTSEFATDPFVHTAVEFPKYSDNCITDEEKQLLLYSENSPTMSTDVDASCFVINHTAETTDRLDAFRDYGGPCTRGFLETIVEENSDDLRSPSECDESSLGWGSWDESDDDRVTVVEMQTNSQQNISPCCVANSPNNDSSKQFPNNQHALSDDEDQNDLSFSSLSSFNIDDLSFTDPCDNKTILNSTNIEHFYKQPPANMTSYNFDNNKYSDLESLPHPFTDTAPEANGSLCQRQTADDILFFQSNSGIADLSMAELDNSITEASCLQHSKSGFFNETFLTSETSPLINYKQGRDNATDQPHSFQEHEHCPINNAESFIDNENRVKINSADELITQLETDVCLIPSTKTDDILGIKSSMDSFTDYFLPTERYVPLKFDQNSVNISDENFINETNTKDISINGKDDNIRCLRLGFSKDSHESCTEFYSHNEENKRVFETNYISLEQKADALFTPRDGDVAFGTPWFDGHQYKEPEVPSDGESRTETLSSTIEADVGRLTMPLLEPISLSPANERRKKTLFEKPSSDDELAEVSSSLSRWQHHTDLQKLEEVTSPLSRWQHQPNLFKAEPESQINVNNNFQSEEEEEYSEFSEQLKNIYSSSKMQDRKMSRIKIKGSKKSKNLGLWDTETKVTLPPFSGNQKLKDNDDTCLKKAHKEDLDDLELDMFDITSEFGSIRQEINDKCKIKTSKSLENFGTNISSPKFADSLTCEFPEHRRSKSSADLLDEDIYNELMEISQQESIKMKEDENNCRLIVENHHKHNILGSKSTDECEKCPLCKDANFLKSDKLFLPPLQKSYGNSNLLNLLNKTFPQMSQINTSEISNYSEHNIPKLGEVDKILLNSPSPVTSSDSDEGVAHIRCEDSKKKNKKRPSKGIHENKHDDSGYVEDDEDDEEEDDMLEEDDHVRHSRRNTDIIANKTNILNPHLQPKIREFENDSQPHLSELLIVKADNIISEIIPTTFQTECSSKPEIELSKKEFIPESGKRSVPSQLSEFSAWLLDRELAKISSKDLMERLIVSDILHLKEQTIKQMLENPNVKEINENFSNDHTTSKDSLSDNNFSVDENGDLVNSSKVKNSLDIENTFLINSKDSKLDLNKIAAVEPRSNAEFLNTINKDEHLIYDKITTASSLEFNNDKSLHSRSKAINHDELNPCIAATITAEHLFDDKCLIESFNSKFNHICQEELDHVDLDKSFCFDAFGDIINNDDDLRPFKTSGIVSEVHDLSQHISSGSPTTNNNTLSALENSAVGPTPFRNSEQNSVIVMENISHDLEDKSTSSFKENKNTDLLISKTNAELTLFEKHSELKAHIENVLPSGEENGNVNEPGNERSKACLLSYSTFSPIKEEEQKQKGASKKECHEQRDIATLQGIDTHGISQEISHLHLPIFKTDVTNLQYDLKVSGSTTRNDEWHQPSLSADANQTNTTTVSSLACVEPVEWDATELNDLSRTYQNKELINNSSQLSLSAETFTDKISELSSDASVNSEVILQKRCENAANVEILSENELNSFSEIPKENAVGELITDKNIFDNHFMDISSESVFDNSTEFFKTVEFVNEVERNDPPLEYRRSKSLVRDADINEDSDLLTCRKQSKSSPDLRQCEEGFISATSGPPLSALLSKSVSQRIQDYLDQKNRGSVLNKSLPPSERSRHYRRICVSTETVAERAARFESRHRSLSSNGGPRRPPTLAHLCAEPRSGSCPPLGGPAGIQNNSTWSGLSFPVKSSNGKRDSFLPRQSPSYTAMNNMPIAAVRPCVGNTQWQLFNGDTKLKKYRNTQENNYSNIDDSLERITAYGKATSTKTLVCHKPPLPACYQTASNGQHTAVIKVRIASARKDFFEKLSRQNESHVKKEVAREDEKPLVGFDRLDVFRRSAREERDRLAASHPDLGALEAAVRSSRRRIDALKKKKIKNNVVVAGNLAPADFNNESPGSSSRCDRDSGSGGVPNTTIATAAKGRTPVEVPYRRCTGEIAWASCARRLQEAREKEQSRSQSYLETDIDSHEQRPPAAPAKTSPVDESARARSLFALSEALAAAAAQHQGEYDDEDDREDGGAAFDEEKSPIAISATGEELFHCRARSMDFLLDEQNRERALPPENRLGSGQGRVKSEHELRVERSLQNLTVPDWYKRSAKPKEGFILRRGSEGAASENANKRRWKGFSSSRTPSASSLASNSYSQRSVVIPKRITAASSSTEWRYGSSLMSSRESLPPASPASLSPRDCGTFQYSSLSRWSSARLSTGSAPITAWTANRSFRQPYLGWRAAAASTAHTPTSCSRSSPGVSPAASSPLYGSRPVSPRRSSQEHHHYPQQPQVTSSATLRPEQGDAPDTARISPLALYDNANGVFFSTEIVVPQFDDVLNTSNTNRAYDDNKYKSNAWPTLRRDRYSYTQSLYNPGILVSPGLEEDGPHVLFGRQHAQDILIHQNLADEDKSKMLRSPQLSPRIWMESSFVGTKKDEVDGTNVPIIHNVSTTDEDTQAPSYARAVAASSSIRSTCAPTKQMGSSRTRSPKLNTTLESELESNSGEKDTKELIEHLHSFLRNLQERPMPTVSAFSYRPENNVNGHQKEPAIDKEDDHPTLVEYDSEPKTYPRGAWRQSRCGSSKDPSPASSTDNELWTSVYDDVVERSRDMVDTTDPMDTSHSISPASPQPPSGNATSSFHVKRGFDDGASSRPIFFASSRRGSKGSSETNRDGSGITDCQQRTDQHQQSSSSRRSSRSESEGHRDSRSGSSSGGAGRRDSRTTIDSSSATGRDRDSKSASLEEVLDSLLAIPSSSRSSSPTSPRRSKPPTWHKRVGSQQQSRPLSSTSPQENDFNINRIKDKNRQESCEGDGEDSGDGKHLKSYIRSSNRDGATSGEDLDHPKDQRPQGKIFDDLPSILPFLPPITTSSSTTQLPPTPSEEVDSEVNPGSFCRSLSPDEDGNRCRSSTSMEVLVPEGEDQEVLSIADDDVNLTEDYPIDETVDLQRSPSPLPPMNITSPCPSCSHTGESLIPCLGQGEQDLCVNPFAGLEQGSYCRGVAERQERHSLCLVLLHLPCMFCARTVAPPPSVNTFQHHQSNDPIRVTVSEPSTPTYSQVPRMTGDNVRSDREGCFPGDTLGNLGGVCHVTRQPAPNQKDPFLSDLVGSDSGHEEKKETGPTAKSSTIDDQDSTPKKSGKKKTSSCAGTNSSHLKCHRPKCTKSLPVEEARAKFRTCPNCYTYYCSRQCRKLHFSRHKDQCPHTRISNLCKQVLMKARDDHMSRRHLSLCAKRGLLSRGRGAVKLLFLCPEDALDYLVHGWESSCGQTLYVSRSDLLPQEMGSDVFSQVRSFCDKYNPERKFILLAAITVTNDVSTAKGSCRDREVVVRGAKMHLSPSLPEDDVQTLILTMIKEPTTDPSESLEVDRKKGLDSVIEQLNTRGVDLQRFFPDIYQKMLKFVEKNEPFVPVSIFPTDKRSGRVFMCIILPWADADIIGNISAKTGMAKSSKKRWIR